nr:lysozyme inhibitor LprI family protein [Rhodanobacter sp. DHB23]
MRRYAVILLWGITASGPVSAQQVCDSQNFNSHAAQIDCEIKQTQLKSLEVKRVFDAVMAANARFEKIPGTAPNLFTASLRDDQKQWRAWVAEDCRLQGELTMGTAGADVEQDCLQDAYSQRIKVLQQMIQTLAL